MFVACGSKALLTQGFLLDVVLLVGAGVSNEGHVPEAEVLGLGDAAARFLPMPDPKFDLDLAAVVDGEVPLICGSFLAA